MGPGVRYNRAAWMTKQIIREERLPEMQMIC